MFSVSISFALSSFIIIPRVFKISICSSIVLKSFLKICCSSSSIAGYWNYCDQYFNKIGIHDLVDGGSAKAADFVQEATIKANWYHADAMITYFGPNGYDVLTEEQLKLYEDMRAANGGDNGGGTGEETTETAQ